MWTVLARGARVGRIPRSDVHARLASTSSASSAGPKSALTLGRAVSTLAAGAIAYGVGVAYPPTLISVLFPQPAPAPPTASSAEGLAVTERIESQIQNLPDVIALRNQPDKWYETRPHSHIPEERRVNSLTAGSLRGPGKVAVAPLVFATHDDKDVLSFVHLGRALCGHDGIIHGGLLATLMDEALARTAIMNFPNKIGVTAKLELNYKAPTMADQFVRLRTTVVKLDGRKAHVKGTVETLEGKVLVEASAIFVEPKYANMLKSSWTTTALGKRVDKSKEGVPVPQEASV
ncbi:Thioesterase/thiol ester dehydrase-isomerase [Clavulina sp. PMI_390]|nr:Thioesterase/thiol ester dehydrase-isomerase [Clavulina sp. PMI_390]